MSNILNANIETESSNSNARPILKWAGGKTQMLEKITPKIPAKYGKYIEPFFGGGAVFFALNPDDAIIADSNPELINLYSEVANNVDGVIRRLKTYENSEEYYYNMRSLDYSELSSVDAAARTIYLNKTCFNGLYRVNKNGQFNVPFGRYKNPNICDEVTLQAASQVLKKATIVCGDYLDVLKKYAVKDDLIFLDPPYLPVSEYSDFKRYTKDQFHEKNHIELAAEVQRLHEMGCHVILTNSNHPLVHELFASFNIDVYQTKRHISSNGKGRKGEDVIVSVPPKKNIELSLVPELLPEQVYKYPSTRFMGSKSKLLSQIWDIASKFEFESVCDLFSGSGIVSYMFKAQGKTVISNDYMAMSSTFTKAMIENNTVTISVLEAEKLLVKRIESDHFVSNTFKDLYFTDQENDLIDTLRTNILVIKSPYKRAIAMTALIRACTKKRPRGIFTYTGDRYNDGRKDLRKTLELHFLEAIMDINNSVFDNGKINKSKNSDAMKLRIKKPDLIYIDPPYYSPLSDNEYVRRYHFVEGLARNWQGVEIQEHTQTKKFKSYSTPFSTKKGAADAFDAIFKKYVNSILIVSYSSNSLPTLDEMVLILSKYKENVEVVPVNYRYSFGNQGNKVSDNKNKVQEYLFVAY